MAVVIPRNVVRSVLVLAASALPVAPSGATTLIRQNLDLLTRHNELILRATVLELHSYWNADRTLILTDVRARPELVLKGAPLGDVTFTLMGGTVGSVTTLVVGGADLAPGSDYVLFLTHADLPGAKNRLTIRDHAQGVFDIEHGRAFSQAMADPLLPDELGETDVPGGEAGIALEDLVREIHDDSNHQGSEEPR
jgi:hypothetical protein